MIRGLEINDDNDSKTFHSDHGQLPAPPVNGVVKLRVLVDRGSIEIFANDGTTVSKTYVLPDPNELGISLVGDQVQLIHVKAHSLKPSWQ
jgi:fructan beta-fructosidase